MSDKKILAICLSVSPPVLIEAAWYKNTLNFGELIRLPTSRRAMEIDVLNAIAEAEKKGFEVLVEETTSFITSRAGQRIRLGENDESGKPLFISVMNIYRELNQQGAIRFPKVGSGGFTLPDSIFDSDKDARGNATYHTDWAALKSTHILTMLCCYASQFHNPASASFLEKMFGTPKETNMRDRYTPMRNIINSIESDQTGFSQSPLTGKGNYL